MRRFSSDFFPFGTYYSISSTLRHINVLTLTCSPKSSRPAISPVCNWAARCARIKEGNRHEHTFLYPVSLYFVILFRSLPPLSRDAPPYSLRNSLCISFRVAFLLSDLDVRRRANPIMRWCSSLLGTTPSLFFLSLVC